MTESYNFIEWDKKHKQTLIRLAGDEQSQQIRLNKMVAAEDMYEALKAAIPELHDAQGEWDGVSEIYAPSWTHLIKSALDQLEASLAEAEGKKEVKDDDKRQQG